MKQACDDMLRFSGEPAKCLNTEYLFTVAVAKELDKLNGSPGDPYKINLEKNAKDFAKDCLHPIKPTNRQHQRQLIRRSGEPKLTRTGRIDIAVYEDIPNNSYLGKQPVCAIELKGFNPSRTYVMKDLKRNLEYFLAQGNTGNSVLGSALFSALYSWKNVGTKSEEQAKSTKLLKNYRGWLSELHHTPQIKKTVTLYQISQNLVGTVIDEGEYQTLDLSTMHNFVGIVVEFSLTNSAIRAHQAEPRKLA
ncbi:hypothetical protein [Alcaligenes faecalis]|uniref:hypothetical protein n=1 Tax=Alcaligenes faecalis TaxID=511 RepID=UPI0024BC2A75|nr:hypothetical protein [Alcaligenes faecalis]WHQ44191.1 hypothetical protein E8D21_11605 [Alcaligenes faecalis]